MATRRRAAIPLLLCAAIGIGIGCGGDAPASRPPESAAAAVRAERGPVLGVAEPNAWRRSPAPASAAGVAAKVASLGAESQRYVVDWSVAEPAPPAPRHRYRFEAFDAMYRAAVARGVRPLIVVLNAPAWAADPGARPGSDGNNPPAASRIGDWAAFAGAVARRYPRALGIEVWNEPNLAEFWGDGSATVRPDPDRYAALLAAASAAVEAERPRMLVVGGALSSTATGSAEGDLDAPGFLRAALAAGAAEHLDAISLHPYPGAGGAPRTLELIAAIRAVRDGAGADVPLWITEVGVTTSGPGAASEREQARALVEICRAVAAQPDVGALYFHNLIEVPGSQAGPEPGFGLLQSLPGGALRAKPAFAAVRRQFAGSCGAR